MSIFVDQSDIVFYTRPAKTKEQRVQILIERGIPFDVNGEGEIVVLKSVFESKLGPRSKATPISGHNFGALTS